mmetsp:Transcript_43578/g.123316  ORF Transcript_43578/g.123316 Transcript_43578/m.123316 type:complete len:542 (+) Transcript_43578:215-1840(+)
MERGRDLVLIVGRVRDARHVLARYVLEVVDPRRHLQLELARDAALPYHLDGAARRHRGELLQGLPVPLANVEVRHGDEPAEVARLHRRLVDTLPADVGEAEDRAHHVHDAPDLLGALPLREVPDHHAAGDRHQPDLLAAALRRVGHDRHLLDEVPGDLDGELAAGAAAAGHPWARRVRRVVVVIALEIVAEEAAEHAQQDDSCEVPVLRLLVPAVEVGVVQPEGQRGVPGVARERVEELGLRRQPGDEVPLHRHGLAQLRGLGQHLVPHPLELEPREVPQLRHLLLREVLLDGRELPDPEARRDHPVLVHLRQGQLRGGHEVHLDLPVQLEPVDLGVDSAAVEEVAEQGDVDGGGVPALLLQEAKLVEELLGGVFVTTVASVDEGAAGEPAFQGVFADGFLKPRAHALQLRPYHEDALADRIVAEHLDGVCDGLVLLEGGSLRIKHVDFHTVELGCVSEGLLGARGVLHEDRVHRGLGIPDPVLHEVLATPDCLLQLARLLVQVPLLLHLEVIHNCHCPAFERVLFLHVLQGPARRLKGQS